MVDMIKLQVFLSLTFETMSEGVNLHLKETFQKQINSD